jgi:D-alanine-D-alanine ligase
MSTNKLKIALILGGISNEREISLKTGKQIEENLDLSKYEVNIYDTKTQLKELFDDCLDNKIDLCFLALHGKGGEDGTIQGMLDLLNVPYTGSSTMSSAVTMDKAMSKQALRSLKIPLAKELVFKKGEWNSELVEKEIGFPCVIKPNISGSSVGITIANSKEEFMTGMVEALKHDNKVLVEEYIDGLEITVPILNNRALPIIEICPKNKFFDYEAKYISSKCDEIVPARITPEQTELAQRMALDIHQTLNCSGLTRVDFILKSNMPYFLEINTLPGMTKNSLCPKSADADGITFSELLDEIITSALNDWRQ